MPDREARPSRDLDSVPSFLGDAPAAGRGRTSKTTRDEAPNKSDGPAMPRPATPAPKPDQDARPRLDPASLPMPTLSRRRVVTAAGVLAAALLTLSFVRQVGEASAATD